MKRIVSAAVTMAMAVVGTLSVSATESGADFVSNMDAATFIETRTAQIKEADLTPEQEALLLKHIEEVAANGLFGNGPMNGEKGEGNAACVLGENDLGVFRSPSAGQRTGEGNGVGLQAQDGTGAGKGNGRGNGNGYQGMGGSGLRDGSASGARSRR